MSTKKISELGELTTPASDDIIAIVDTSTSTTKQISVGNLITTYVDAGIATAIAGEMTLKGDYNASTNTPDLDTTPIATGVGDMYIVTVAGTFFTVAVEAGDMLIAKQATATSEAHWSIVNRNIDSTAFATAAQGTLADAALPIAGGTLTGDLTLDNTASIISTNTTDAADNKSLTLAGGGGVASTRGASVGLYGNENTAFAGHVRIQTGNTGGADIELITMNSSNTPTTHLIVKDDTGKVGIGTTSPDTLLEVSGSDGEIIRIESTKNGTWVDEDILGGFEIYGSDASDAGPGVKTAIRALSEGTGGGKFNLAFTTSEAGFNDVERMRINSTGNVGIGTNSPNAKLSIRTTASEVEGLTVLNDDNTSEIFKVINTIDSGGYIDLRDDANVTKVRLSSYAHTYFNGGKVGIGTTSPDTLLHVDGGDVKISSDSQSNNGDGIPTLFFSEDTGGNVIAQISYHGDDESGGNNFIGIGCAGSVATTEALMKENHQMVIKASGKVGIGTTSPSHKLHVAQGEIRVGNTTSSNQDLVLKGDVTPGMTVGGSTKAAVITTSGISTGAAHVGIEIPANDANDGFYVATDSDFDGVVDTLAMKIIANGNVGIGTSSPDDKLDVAGAIRLTTNMSFNAGLAGRFYKASNHGLAIHGVTGTENDVAFFTPAGSLLMVNPTGTNNVVLCKSSGNVGIGTSSPSKALDIVGDFRSYRNSSAVTEQVRIEQDGTGDATLSFALSATKAWMMGIDNSDGDKFKIGSSNANLSTSNALTIDSTGKVGIGTTSPTHKLWIYDSDYQQLAISGARPTMFLHETNGTANQNYQIRVDNGALLFQQQNDAQSSASTRMELSSSGVLKCPKIYANTTSNASNTYVNSAGQLYRSTSSIKYKKDVETMKDSYADAILNLRPVWFKSKSELDEADWGYWGLIAEEVGEIDPRLVHWKTVDYVDQETETEITIPAVEAVEYAEATFDDNGDVLTEVIEGVEAQVERIETQTNTKSVAVPLETPEAEGVQYDRIVPHLINLLQRQDARITALEAKMATDETITEVV